MMGVNNRNMQSCLHKCNQLNKSHLVGHLLNSIHNAQTNVYKFLKFSEIFPGCLNVVKRNFISIFQYSEKTERI